MTVHPTPRVPRDRVRRVPQVEVYGVIRSSGTGTGGIISAAGLPSPVYPLTPLRPVRRDHGWTSPSSGHGCRGTPHEVEEARGEQQALERRTRDLLRLLPASGMGPGSARNTHMVTETVMIKDLVHPWARRCATSMLCARTPTASLQTEAHPDEVTGAPSPWHPYP